MSTNESAERRRQRLLDEGLCVNCGREPLVTTRYGENCLDKRRRHNRTRNYAEENRARAERETRWTRLRVLPKPSRLIPPTPISAKVHLKPPGELARSFFGSVVSRWGNL